MAFLIKPKEGRAPGSVIMLGTAVALLFAAFLISTRLAVLSNVLFFCFWCALAFGSTLRLLEKRPCSRATVFSIALILFFFLCFWIATLRESVVHCRVVEYFPIHYSLAAVGIFSMAISLFCWGKMFFLCGRFPLGIKMKSLLRRDCLVLLIVFLFLLLSLPNFTYLFKNDSYVYYSTVVGQEGTWDFSLPALKAFDIGYHSSYGYSLFVFFANYLLRRFGIGIHLVHLTLIVVSALLFNDLLHGLFPSNRPLVFGLFSALFLFNPLVLAQTQEMSTDFPLLCFFVWFVWAYCRKWNVFTVFFGLLVCFSREYGVVLLFLFVFGMFLTRVGGMLKDWFRAVKPVEWLLAVPAVFAVVAIVIVSSWGKSEPDAAAAAVGLPVNSFLIDPTYIKIKLSLIFLLNFQWVYWLVLLFGVVVRLCNSDRPSLPPEYHGVLWSFFGYLLIQLLYFTYPHYRYTMLDAFYYAFFLAAVFSGFRRKGIVRLALAGLAALFAVQCYRPLDPVTNRCFRQVPTGNGTILSIAYYGTTEESDGKLVTEAQGADLSDEAFRDYVQNNRQYLWFEDCFEDFLQDIGYTEDQAILLSPIFNQYYWGKQRWTMANLFGITDLKALHWNAGRHQLSYESDDTEIKWLSPNSPYVGNYQKYWYVEFPYKPGWDYPGYRDQFRILDERTYEKGQWSFTAYEIERPRKVAYYMTDWE